MNTTRTVDPAQSTSSTVVPANRLDTVKRIIINKFLTAMFDPEFGIGDYLGLTQTDSIQDFQQQFSPHGEVAIRIALELDADASLDEVKQNLKGKTIERQKIPDSAKLMGMPERITIDDVRCAERELTPLFAKIFGLDETATEDELRKASNLVLGVLQREKMI